MGLFLCCSPACAPKKAGTLPPDLLRNLVCRIVTFTDGPVRSIEPLIDRNLDTLSNDPADQSLGTVIHDGRTLAARVQHVSVALPRERFNVEVTVDGATYIRINHMDLDIYLETTVQGRVYALHCFPPFAEVRD